MRAVTVGPRAVYGATSAYQMVEKTPAPRRVIPLLLSVISTTVAGIASISILIGAFGPAAWGNVAVAQTAGGLLAVLVSFGWNVVGGAEVGGASNHDRGAYFLGSLISRSQLAILVFAACGVLFLMGIRPPEPAFLLIMGTPIVSALGSPWFFVGERRLWRAFLLDSLPRASGTLLGCGSLIILEPNLNTFASIQFAGATLAALLSTVDVLLRYRPIWLPVGIAPSLRRLGRSWGGFATSATAAVYLNVPLLYLSVIDPTTTAVYAMGERLKMYALTAQIPLSQWMQGFIADRDGAGTLQTRIERAIRSTAGFAGLFGIAFLGLAPWAAHILSGGAVDLTPITAGGFAISVSAVVVSGVVGPACLVSIGRTRILAISTFVGAIVSLILVISTASQAGAIGVAWSVAAAEVLVVAIQLLSVWNWRRGRAD